MYLSDAISTRNKERKMRLLPSVKQAIGVRTRNIAHHGIMRPWRDIVTTIVTE